MLNWGSPKNRSAVLPENLFYGTALWSSPPTPDLASEGALDHGDSVGGDSGALGVKEGLAAVAL